MHTYRAGVENPAVLHILASDPATYVTHGTADTPPPAAAASISLLEDLLELLSEAQLPMKERVRVFRGLISLVVGFIAVQVGGFLPPASGRQRRPVSAEPAPEPGSALLEAIAPTLERDDPAAALGFTVRLFVQGVQSLPRQRSGARQ